MLVRALLFFAVQKRGEWKNTACIINLKLGAEKRIGWQQCAVFGSEKVKMIGFMILSVNKKFR